MGPTCSECDKNESAHTERISLHDLSTSYKRYLTAMFKSSVTMRPAYNHYIYRPRTKLRGGNVFIGVCLCSQGGRVHNIKCIRTSDLMTYTLDIRPGYLPPPPASHLVVIIGDLFKLICLRT